MLLESNGNWNRAEYEVIVSGDDDLLSIKQREVNQILTTTELLKKLGLILNLIHHSPRTIRLT